MFLKARRANQSLFRIFSSFLSELVSLDAAFVAALKTFKVRAVSPRICHVWFSCSSLSFFFCGLKTYTGFHHCFLKVSGSFFSFFELDAIFLLSLSFSLVLNISQFLHPSAAFRLCHVFTSSTSHTRALAPPILPTSPPPIFAQVPIVSYGAKSDLLSSEIATPYFARVELAQNREARVMLSMCRRYGWTRIAVLYSSDAYAIFLIV